MLGFSYKQDHVIGETLLEHLMSTRGDGGPVEGKGCY